MKPSRLLLGLLGGLFAAAVLLGALPLLGIRLADSLMPLAWGLLLLLALTSFDAAIRWLGGKRWRALHRAVYLVVPLALLHFYWMRSGKRNCRAISDSLGKRSWGASLKIQRMRSASASEARPSSHMAWK